MRSAEGEAAYGIRHEAKGGNVEARDRRSEREVERIKYERGRMKPEDGERKAEGKEGGSAKKLKCGEAESGSRKPSQRSVGSP